MEEGHAGRGAVNKDLIVIGVETKDDGSRGRARMKVIESATASARTGFIKDNLLEGSRLVTDGREGYSLVITQGFAHEKKIMKNDKQTLPHVHSVPYAEPRLLRHDC
ncbi:MAG: transposase [Deltaproteobacteria bacterium]|nr:transposase [Deltaproteobacteria bacterium]